MTPEALIKAYHDTNPRERCISYTAWQFGTDADALAALVCEGKKTATASACPLYAAEDLPLPRAGEYSVVLNSREEAVCLIRTTEVAVVPFSAVTAAHAHAEGEGDQSLTHWRRVHEDFFRAELQSIGQDFSWDMPVVLERFVLLFRADDQIKE